MSDEPDPTRPLQTRPATGNSTAPPVGADGAGPAEPEDAGDVRADTANSPAPTTPEAAVDGPGEDRTGLDPTSGGEGDFSAMLDQSIEAREFAEGETVSGEIVALRPDVAFVHIGGKSEATIDIAELKDDEGDLTVEVGETIEAVVVSVSDGLRLSRKLAKSAAARRHLDEAFRSGLPVEGRVEKTNKGGFDVQVAGSRAFCPISQIDLVRTEDPSVHVGKTYTFRITEYKDGGKNLVVSRRKILQEEARKKAEETRKTIVAGAVLPGKVASVREYGAFVDMGGIQGLLHVSEMGWGRIKNPSEVLKPGDEITVKVLKVDDEKGRISLGLKQLQSDPWSKVAEKYAVGQVVTGKIVRKQEFGAFVELEPGVEALAHVSTFPPTGSPQGWKKTISEGQEASFEVLKIDLDRKRIGVAMLEEGSARAGVGAARDAAGAGGNGVVRIKASDIRPGARLVGKVERHERFGVFIFLAPGRTGLMPASESGVPRGTDLRKTFPPGGDIEVVVLEVDPSGRRIRLSRKAALDAEEKAEARDYARRSHRPDRKQSQEAFGSFGAKLRAALDGRKK